MTLFDSKHCTLGREEKGGKATHKQDKNNADQNIVNNKTDREVWYQKISWTEWPISTSKNYKS